MRKYNPVVIAFTGYAQVGKDSAAGFLEEVGYTKLAFADPLRAAVHALNPIVDTYWPSEGATPRHRRVQDVIGMMGYEEAKKIYPEYRALLQRMGTEVGREQFGENFWVERLTSQFKAGGFYVISDARFSNEVDAIHENGGKVYRITRPGTEAVNTHVSDTGVDTLTIDGVIPNTGDLNTFRELVLDTVGVI